MKFLVWILSIIAALLMLQTLYFKFSSAPESVMLFTELKMEPYGRYGVGVLELVAAVLLLIPRVRIWGALMGMALMSGALFFHLTIIGILDSTGSPLLFLYALVVFTCCALLVWILRKNLRALFRRK